MFWQGDIFRVSYNKYNALLQDESNAVNSGLRTTLGTRGGIRSLGFISDGIVDVVRAHTSFFRRFQITFSLISAYSIQYS